MRNANWPKISPHLRCDVLEAKTLCEVIQHRAIYQKDKLYCTLVEPHGEKSITFGELHDHADQYGRAMRSFGLEIRERVAIMLPTSMEFLFSYFGAMLAGLVPAAISPPFMPRGIEFFAKEKAEMLKRIGASALIASKQGKKTAAAIKNSVPGIKHSLTPEDMEQCSCNQNLDGVISSKDMAMIQFSSGSSGKPKGIILTHSNLMNNIKAVHLAMGTTPEDVNVSWLPLYHDMGLIGCVCGALFAGCHLVLMSPTMFMSSPLFWLRVMHQKSGTISVAPNFGYQLCVDRARELDVGKIDLSAWRCALVGSEMVTENTLAGFVEKFIPFGFRKETFMPVYGLAEATLAVCFTPPNTGPLIDQVNLRGLVTKGIAEPAGNGEGNISFVSVGKHIPGVEVKVVDQTGTEVDERIQGKLLVRSPSVMVGYFNDPMATREVLRDGWLDTGDLAYRVNDYIFVTGRSKDVIIKAGRNYNPEYIEQTVWSVPGIRKHSVVAFGVLSREKGTENIVVIAEARVHKKEEVGKLVLAIKQAVSRRVELTPDEVVIVQPQTIPKTTSGKVRRALCRRLYLDID